MTPEPDLVVVGSRGHRAAVGPVDRWPQSLRTALSILLETGAPRSSKGAMLLCALSGAPP